MKIRHIILLSASALLASGCTSAISFKPTNNNQIVDSKAFLNQLDFLFASNPLFLGAENPIAYSYEMEIVVNNTEETSYKSPFSEELLYKKETKGESKSIAKYDSVNCILSQSGDGKSTTTTPEEKTVTTTKNDYLLQSGSDAVYTLNLLKNVYSVYKTENALEYIQQYAISGIKTYASLIKKVADGDNTTCYVGSNVYTVSIQNQTTSESVASSETGKMQLVVEENSFTINIEEKLARTTFSTMHEYYNMSGTSQIKVTRKAVTLSRKDMSKMAEEKTSNNQNGYLID